MKARLHCLTLFVRQYRKLAILLLLLLAVALRPNAGHGLLIHEVSRSHNDATQSVGLLWTSDQLVAETST